MDSPSKEDVELQEEIDAEKKQEEKDVRKTKLRAIIKRVEAGITEIAEITAEIPSVFLENFSLIALVVGVGIGMILLRFVVMLACPEIAHHAKTYATVINFLFGIVESAFEIITIKNAINLLGFATDAEASPFELAQEVLTVTAPYTFMIVHFKNLLGHVNWHTFSTTDIQEFFSKLPVECAKYNNIQEVFLFPVKAMASPAVCPLIRVTWPVEWLYTVTNGVFGWMSWNADPTDNNCVAHDHDAYAWVCVALGMGYIIIDVVLPLLLFMLFAYKYIFPIGKVVIAGLQAVTIEAESITEKVASTAEGVVDDIEAVAKASLDDIGGSAPGP
jgi:hypothetical protein